MPDISLGVDIDKLDLVLRILKDQFKVLIEDPVAFAKKTNDSYSNWVKILDDRDNA